MWYVPRKGQNQTPEASKLPPLPSLVPSSLFGFPPVQRAIEGESKIHWWESKRTGDEASIGIIHALLCNVSSC